MPPHSRTLSARTKALEDTGRQKPATPQGVRYAARHGRIRLRQTATARRGATVSTFKGQVRMRQKANGFEKIQVNPTESKAKNYAMRILQV